jgi:integrase
MKNKKRKYGEGSIFERADGRWVVTLRGSGKRKFIYCATPEEATVALARARNQQLDGIPFTDARLTVGRWLETWLKNMKPPSTAPKTWISYEGFVRLHLAPCLGDIRLKELQPQHVRDFMSQCLGTGLSPRTVKHLRDALRAALNQAIGDDLIQRNVAARVKPPEMEPRALDVYTPAEARMLIEAARGHRLEALFTAATALGLRKGECLGLQWPDIDFARLALTVAHNLQRVKRVRRGDVVKAGEAKTERLLQRRPKGKKIKSLRMPAAVAEALLRHRDRQAEERRLAGSAWKGDGKYVFTSTVGTPIEPRQLDHEFKALCDAARLRRIRFHDLRHSAASILIAQGVHPKAIQELLRHSSIQLTMDTYGHLFDEMHRETADKMDAVLAPKQPLLDVKLDVKTASKKPN